METSSERPLRRRVFTMNSRAKCGVGCGSSGRSAMFLSSGSPCARARHEQSSTSVEGRTSARGSEGGGTPHGLARACLVRGC
eukprot:5042237-Pleurochrysis_carterae.AAC.1